MKDLKSAISLVLSHGCPVKVDEKDAGVLISQKFLDILLAEYNIHFVEPDAKQLEFSDEHPFVLECTIDNYKLRP
jgi:hypothetical protein